MATDPEGWRVGQIPSFQGPWSAAQAWLGTRGHTPRIWSDLKVQDTASVQLWLSSNNPSTPGLILDTLSGERLGLTKRTA